MWSLLGRGSLEKRVSRLLRKIEPSTLGSARIPGASSASGSPAASTNALAGASLNAS
jgi:hypothetical protein